MFLFLWNSEVWDRENRGMSRNIIAIATVYCRQFVATVYLADSASFSKNVIRIFLSAHHPLYYVP